MTRICWRYFPHPPHDVDRWRCEGQGDPDVVALATECGDLRAEVEQLRKARDECERQLQEWAHRTVEAEDALDRWVRRTTDIRIALDRVQTLCDEPMPMLTHSLGTVMAVPVHKLRAALEGDVND